MRLSEGSYFILYKGILGGLLEVAVKVVEFTKGAPAIQWHTLARLP